MPLLSAAVMQPNNGHFAKKTEWVLHVLNFYGSQLNRISDAISVKRGELLRIKKLLQSRLGTSDTAARYHYEDMILRINTALGIK